MQKRRKKTLAPLAGFCKSGIVTSLLLQFQFLKGPAPRRVFSFLAHRNPSDSGKQRRAELRESDWPSQSLPEYLPDGKRDTTYG